MEARTPTKPITSSTGTDNSNFVSAGAVAYPPVDIFCLSARAGVKKKRASRGGSWSAFRALEDQTRRRGSQYSRKAEITQNYAEIQDFKRRKLKIGLTALVCGTWKQLGGGEEAQLVPECVPSASSVTAAFFAAVHFQACANGSFPRA